MAKVWSTKLPSKQEELDAVPRKLNILLNTDTLAAADNLFVNYPLDLQNFPIAFLQLKKAQQQERGRR